MSVSSRMEQLEVTVDELKRLINLTDHNKVREILALDVRKVETEITLLREQSGYHGEGSSSGIRNAYTRCYDVGLTNYAWDQDYEYVKIYITLKNLQSLSETNIICIFTESSLSLRVNGLDGKNHILNMVNLLQKISIPTSYWKIKRDTLTVFLAKSTPGIQWSHLTSVEKSSSYHEVPTINTEGLSESTKKLADRLYNLGDDHFKREFVATYLQFREALKPLVHSPLFAKFRKCLNDYNYGGEEGEGEEGEGEEFEGEEFEGEEGEGEEGEGEDY